ncbi:Aspartate/glutamate/uridylate kinase OS=Pirellula staleyi (strain ATCC 27377 / DSM 6068 / ICPB 4128) GN=Psta_3593 PE=4 SV=1 [Gemmataceae bacterium]|nr:Aspartate/glutamate/uridylate kinase OS=Pirellula staleyi (strain ATCC 27377 / DSM 6068 / ICPB 4128) GN=Psta_3593 PE=4 SV=1 [Gemmataceae bacterium]VTT96911.1 Aspartate/glutamate/uridylate kinase OS=Pirellula staleyi (strain ATCC 27377 / DSM 6068 / ICPB 4128) GN=Psta_3593 PE=4 SV=1 [Gemmataceae bacterium]
MIVVKVGGSLYDHPRLGPGLRAYLDSLAPAEVWLVPGGGDVVEAIRTLDRVHALGDDACHALAVRGMELAGEFLHELIGFGSDRVSFPALDLCAVPHSWDVTSDSIAARIARDYSAERLVLLKSVDVPAGVPWAAAAENGWVDRYFPTVVAGAAFPVEVVNFRRVLDALP